LKNASFGIIAVVQVPENGAEGVLMTQGGRFAGLGLYVKDGCPVFHYNDFRGIGARRLQTTEDRAEAARLRLADVALPGNGTIHGGAPLAWRWF